MSEVSGDAPLSVLLLEDDPADSRLLIESLREQIVAGTVVVRTVRRLADALRELKRSSFACVLVDLGLPDASGVAHVASIRQANPGAAIIVLTGLVDRHAAEEAFRLGAHDYLVKRPRSGDKLLELVRGAIAKRNAQQTATPSAGAVEPDAELRFQPWVDVGRVRFAGLHIALRADPDALTSALAAFASCEEDLRPTSLALSIPAATLTAALDDLSARVEQAGLRISNISLRLPAAELAGNADRIEQLSRLRGHGAQVWLEGWASGAAPLDGLVEWPLDGLVLNPQVAARLSHDPDEQSLRFVRGSLALARALDLGVIADGVTLAEQHARLNLLGCRLMQGSWFCPPETVAALPARWRKWPWGFERR